MKLKIILTAFLAISMITTVSACDFSDQPSDHWDMPDNYIDIISDGHIHQKAPLTIPFKYNNDIRLPTQGEIEEIGAFQYEDIEITSRQPPEPPEAGKTGKIILEHF